MRLPGTVPLNVPLEVPMHAIRRFLAAAFLTYVANAAAVPIADPDGQQARLFSSGGDVVVTFLGYEAGENGFPMDSIVLRVNGQEALALWDDIAVGDSFDLGNFDAGVELEVQVLTRHGARYATGPWWRNSDDKTHARVESNFGSPGTSLVTFTENGFQGTEWTDQLLSFSFTSSVAVPVPEPATITMLLAGILALGLAGLKRKAGR
jgi:hypothetical protein